METQTLQTSTKVVPAKKYFCYATRTTLNKINEVANAEIGPFMEAMNRLGLQPAGPMEFLYWDCTSDMDKIFDLEIAMPVNTVVELANKKYRFRSAEAFKCLSLVYHGDISKIDNAYEMLFGHIGQNHLKTTNHIREVYEHYIDLHAAENITEIQIGLE